MNDEIGMSDKRLRNSFNNNMQAIWGMMVVVWLFRFILVDCSNGFVGALISN